MDTHSESIKIDYYLFTSRFNCPVIFCQDQNEMAVGEKPTNTGRVHKTFLDSAFSPSLRLTNAQQ